MTYMHSESFSSPGALQYMDARVSLFSSVVLGFLTFYNQTLPTECAKEARWSTVSSVMRGATRSSPNISQP